MKALVSPMEVNENGYYRIPAVSQEEFEVAEPMFWIDCSEDTTPDFHAYDHNYNKIVVARVVEVPPPPPDEEEPIAMPMVMSEPKM